MLAIRQVIADRGGIGVYLFDEIDSGMGGKTAFQVGKKLKSVALYNQVICITHLPQVASFADHHLVVRKKTKDKRTLTQIIELGGEEKKEEIARMLGGPALTKKSLENASELLELASKPSLA
jgi:DNA repair protein RecN (Recombination protein N)